MRLFQAELKDVPRILDCAREFCAVIPDCPLDEAHYAKAWTGLLESGQGAIFLLDQDGQIVGGIGGLKHPELLTGRLSAVELFWYVKLAHRHGLWPVRLLKEFERWAAAQRCQQVAMIHLECSMPERLREFYLRSGYTLCETVYRKALGGGV